MIRADGQADGDDGVVPLPVRATRPLRTGTNGVSGYVGTAVGHTGQVDDLR